jgi:hypothetical protein
MRERERATVAAAAAARTYVLHAVGCQHATPGAGKKEEESKGGAVLFQLQKTVAEVRVGRLTGRC